MKVEKTKETEGVEMEEAAEMHHISVIPLLKKITNDRKMDETTQTGRETEPI